LTVFSVRIFYERRNRKRDSLPAGAIPRSSGRSSLRERNRRSLSIGVGETTLQLPFRQAARGKFANDAEKSRIIYSPHRRRENQKCDQQEAREQESDGHVRAVESR
jgi:hypothetical protein